jgi:hypothetical protein
MSVAAYVRRAAVAFAEHDTGELWDEVMSDEPGFGVYGERPGRGAIRVNGRGFGPWKIVKLESHHRDDDE